MLIVDGHLDLAWNALQGQRDLRLSAYTIRTQEKSGESGRGRGTVALPEMRRGRVALCFATLFARSTGHPVRDVDFTSPAQAYAVAAGQLAYYRALEQEGLLKVVVDIGTLQHHFAAWDAWETEVNAPPETIPPVGCVVGMEGADPIRDPEQLAEWWQAGLRLLGLAHYGSGRYAGGTGVEVGLTDLGRHLLPEMARLGVVCDVTHLSDASFWEVVQEYAGPLLASHSNCRALVAHQRQLDDDQLCAVIARDGVIGVCFDAWMLRLGWSPGAPNSVTLANVVDQLDHLCQLAGDSRHAALGSDLDGGFGREQSPADLDTIADLPKLIGLLEKRGYGQDDVRNLLHGNWLRRLHTAWERSAA